MTTCGLLLAVPPQVRQRATSLFRRVSFVMARIVWQIASCIATQAIISLSLNASDGTHFLSAGNTSEVTGTLLLLQLLDTLTRAIVVEPIIPSCGVRVSQALGGVSMARLQLRDVLSRPTRMAENGSF